ncbi:hypothetical protein O9X98_20575 [Agrobacterium salinitolerans]|nr:hypothetical protein [Agrobacterium salinitolerans]
MAAMIKAQFPATLLPCLRRFSNFSIAFSWRRCNVRQKIPADMSNFICIAAILLRRKKFLYSVTDVAVLNVPVSSHQDRRNT